MNNPSISIPFAKISILLLLLLGSVTSQIDPDGNSIKFNMINRVVSVSGGAHKGEPHYLKRYQNKADRDEKDTYMEFVPISNQTKYWAVLYINTGMEIDESITDAEGALDFYANVKTFSPHWKIQIRNFSTRQWENLGKSKEEAPKIWSKWGRSRKVKNIADYFSPKKGNESGQIMIRIISLQSLNLSALFLDYISIRFKFFPFWHCRNRCTVTCDDSVEEWESRMNRKCWGFYIQKRRFPHIVSYFGIRRTCECPSRDYTISNACEPWTQANQRHCILSEISQSDEINFGNLYNVYFRRVEAFGFEMDIDFQGRTSNSLFCELVAAGDIEFGGGECPIQFRDNEVHSISTGKDLQFEQGTFVGPGNVFQNVNVGDDFQFNLDAGATRDTEVFDNTWGDINVDDKCNFNVITPADVSVVGNTCDWFYVDDDNNCGPVFSGFDCV